MRNLVIALLMLAASPALAQDKEKLSRPILPSAPH